MKGWSQNKLEEQADLDQGDVSKLIKAIKKETGLTAPKFLALCEAPDVEPAWLLREQGPMRDPRKPPKSPSEKAVAIARLMPLTEDVISAGLNHFESDTIDGHDVRTIVDAMILEDNKARQRSAIDHEHHRQERETFKSGKKRQPPASARAPRSQRNTGTGNKS